MKIPVISSLAALVISVGAHLQDIPYNETLHLRPLPRNSLLTSFEFELESLPAQLRNVHKDGPKTYNHYTYFPRSLGPIIENTNTRELHLRFTQGWWDSEEWGKLPFNGMFSGGTGVELWAVIEASSKKEAYKEWTKLANSLSGLFCASLNFIDQSTTTYPIKSFQPHLDDLSSIVSDPENELFLMRAALPSEPICTENLTPFLKLLPTKGKAGISSLLDGHKIFDALWHGMSIDITTDCNAEKTECKFKMAQTINAVIDTVRSERKRDSGIPKPTPGDDLRCDTTKEFSIYQCFPLKDSTDVSWDLNSLFGKEIAGSALSSHKSSKICAVTDDTWDVTMIKNGGSSPSKIGSDCIQIHDNEKYNVHFKSADSTVIVPTEEPPIIVSRSLTGYSQDNGGFRTVLRNPSKSRGVKFVYFEALPWYMRIYLHTLNLQITGSNSENLEIDQILQSRYYKPAVDRERPSHIEFEIYIPADTTLTLSYSFDKSLLLYSEYPPDANHGFQIEPAVLTVLSGEYYETRTTSLLLTLPTPDFSMPYNVIILTSTVMALTFGAIFNLLVKRTVTEDESDLIAKDSALKKLKTKLQSLKNKFQSLFKKKTN